MRYPKFHTQHLFVGSGVIEAGCKTVIGSRLKRSGMFWTVRGANAILALRCCHRNNRFEDYWTGAPGSRSPLLRRAPYSVGGRIEVPCTCARANRSRFLRQRYR
jgi:hypothetical protein